MKVIVFGATGGTGRQLVERALQKGHEVTAFARRPEAVTLTHPKLRVAKGDVLQADSVAAAMAGQEVALSALGPPAGQPAGTLISEGVRNILGAMKQHRTRRFVFESGIMVSDGKEQSLAMRALLSVFRSMNQALFEDKVRAEALIVGSDLEWVIVRPPGLSHKPATGAVKSGDQMRVNLLKMMPHADVADFMLRVASGEEYLRQKVAISM